MLVSCLELSSVGFAAVIIFPGQGYKRRPNMALFFVVYARMLPPGESR